MKSICGSKYWPISVLLPYTEMMKAHLTKKNTRSFGSRPSCRYQKRESKAHSAMKTLQFG
ncbi:hypothetical protein BACIH_1050 [Bacillus amyloliquefaciens]|nr:hypothetical protein U471_10790 [Bacillus amyloliquefaciens CC178]QEY88615.1 hypothetical protein BACIT_0650 [Bacillus amyloliquefaciens]QEY92810.1 hypothetical protein BACIH_1050 [Bacillus amyloliquefaciens]